MPTIPYLPADLAEPREIVDVIRARRGGTLQHLDSFGVTFYDNDGNYHSLLLDKNPGLKIETHDPLAGHIELLQQYSDADMHNIFTYLETLK